MAAVNQTDGTSSLNAICRAPGLDSDTEAALHHYAPVADPAALPLSRAGDERRIVVLLCRRRFAA
jgi:hypothetical protein